MIRTARLLLGLLALMTFLIPATDADAFWAVRGARGGVAVGGLIRAPLVANHYYAGGCYRCAPLYAPGAVAAGAAIGAAAATSAMSVAPPPSAPPSSAPPSGATAAAPAASSSPAPASSQPSCVSGLSPDARQIYNAAHNAGVTSADLRDVVTAQTRALVMAGKIPQATARTAAQSAGQCLAQLSK